MGKVPALRHEYALQSVALNHTNQNENGYIRQVKNAGMSLEKHKAQAAEKAVCALLFQ